MRVIIKSAAHGYWTLTNRFKVAFRGEMVDLPREDAEVLISRGEAEEVPRRAATVAPATGESTEGNDTPEAGKPTEAQEEGESGGPYDNMKAQDLRNLMKERGLPCKVGIKNADMIAALEAYDREHAAPEPETDTAALDEDPADVPDEDEIEDGELPPDLSVEAPSV